MNNETIFKEATKLAAKKLGCSEHVTALLEEEVVVQFREVQQKLAERERKRTAVPVDLEELDKSYKDGLETGLNWKDNYVPGGPWYYTVGKHENELRQGLAMQLEAEHYAWMQGWHDGKASQCLQSS